MMKLVAVLCTSLLVVALGCDRADDGQAPAPADQPQQQVTNSPTTPQDKARVLLDQLTQQIGDQNWSAAERTLMELDAMKGAASPELRIEIENARSTYQAAKAIAEQGKPGPG